MDKFFQNLSLSQLFRYGFSGFALLLCAGFLFEEEVKRFREVMGDMLVIVIAFVIGGAIYAAYRAIADIPLYWVHFWLHWCVKWCWPSCVCKLHQDVEGVHACDRLHAYRCIRDYSGHETAIREQFKQFELEHAEIHMLYSFACVLFFTSLAAALTEPFLGWRLFWAIAGPLLIGVIGMIRDVGLCRRECAFLLGNVSNNLQQKILRDARVLPDGSVSPPSTSAREDATSS